jgi:hypothetical protein
MTEPTPGDDGPVWWDDQGIHVGVPYPTDPGHVWNDGHHTYVGPMPGDHGAPTPADVNDAIDQTGSTNTGVVTDWLVQHGFDTSNIPPVGDWSPDVNDGDIHGPDTQTSDLDKFGGTKDPTFVAIEDFRGWSFDEIHVAFEHADDDIAPGYALSWRNISNSIGTEVDTFRQALAQQDALDEWKGKTHDAAMANVNQSFIEPMTIAEGGYALGLITDAFSRAIASAKHYLNTAAASYDVDLKRWPNHADVIRGDFNSYAQAVLSKVYVPTIQDVAARNPGFTSGQQPHLDDLNPNQDPKNGDTNGDDGFDANDLADKLGLNKDGNKDGSQGNGGVGNDGFDANDLANKLGLNTNGNQGGSKGGGLGDDGFNANDLLNNLGQSGTGGGLGDDGFNANDLLNNLGQSGTGGGLGDDGFNANDLLNNLGQSGTGGGLGDPNLLNNLGQNNLGGNGLNGDDGFDGSSLLNNLGETGTGGGLGDDGFNANDLLNNLGQNGTAGLNGDNGIDPSSLLSGLSNSGSDNSGSGLGSLGGTGGGGPAGAASGLTSAGSDALKQALGAGQTGQGMGSRPAGNVPGLPKELKDLAGGGAEDPHGGGPGRASLGRSGLDGAKPLGAPMTDRPGLGAGLSRTGGPAGGPTAGGTSAGSSGGSGSGGGGGGQRGATGKEHKQNKALRGKRNGELVIGKPNAVVPVVGDDGQDTDRAEEIPAAPARRPTPALSTTRTTTIPARAAEEQRAEPRS